MAEPCAFKRGVLQDLVNIRLVPGRLRELIGVI
jgi:hypothetical protein